MILQRLYQLAVREHLLDDLAFETQPIAFVVQLGAAGEYLGVQDRRGTVQIASKKKGAPPRTQLGKGLELPVPRPHGSRNTVGFARYFADTLPRVLPVSDEDKSVRSRTTFWEQIDRAASETDDPALKAVQAFGRWFQGNAEREAQIRAEVERLEPGVSDRCTFAWYPDQGRTILHREPVRTWYARLYQSLTAQREEAGAQGVCQVTGELEPIPRTHALPLSGIPGGSSMGVKLVSYDKDAFQSYGLDGAENACVGYRGADGYARALTALIANRLKGNPTTRLRVGGVLFLFWTREEADTSFMNLLDAPDPAQVERLLQSAKDGERSLGVSDTNDFYLLGLSGNAARAIVREYLETPLSRIQASLARWFRDLRIADVTREGAGKPANHWPLWQLASATALESERIAPETPSRLLQAALKGDLLPDSILAACLGRLRAEGGEGFRPARLALIKLTLLRRNVPVTDTLNPDETHPAYVCGRLLAVFEQIQYAALGDVNASVVDKFFGNFSASPGMVLSRLFAGAQNHLRKLRGEKPGLCVNLEKLLAEVSLKLPPCPPRGQLSLLDQGRFALGYYHQKARRFEEMAERKAAKLSPSAAE